MIGSISRLTKPFFPKGHFRFLISPPRPPSFFFIPFSLRSLHPLRSLRLSLRSLRLSLRPLRLSLRPLRLSFSFTADEHHWKRRGFGRKLQVFITKPRMLTTFHCTAHLHVTNLVWFPDCYEKIQMVAWNSLESALYQLHHQRYSSRCRFHHPETVPSLSSLNPLWVRRRSLWA